MIRPEIHRILRDQLSLDPPAPDTDLIATGLLDSLSIVSLVVELERAFALQIPLDSIDLEAIRTIERLERLVMDAQGGPDEPAEPRRSELGGSSANLVNIKPGVGRPIFLLHTSHGGDFTARSLSAVLDTRRPIWGIIARGYNTSEEPQTRVEEMARTYVEAISAAQPDGPYSLIGYSFGGLIAYEMARQLDANGEEVDTLGLIDVQAGLLALSPMRRLSFRLGAPLRYGRYLCESPRTNIPSSARVALARLHFAGMRNLPEEPSVTAQIARIRDNAARAEAIYAPQPYPGRATLLAARSRGPGRADPRVIWSRLVEGGLLILELPGDHHGIMRTNLAGVGKRLSEVLAPD